MRRSKKPPLDTTDASPASSEPQSSAPAGASALADEQVAESITQSAATPTRELKPKLSIPLNPDGTFDIEGMRQITREKLFSGIDALRVSGAIGETGAIEQTDIPRGLVNGLYGILGGIETMIARRAAPNVPEAQVKALFSYSQKELDVLYPCTNAVLKKYDLLVSFKYKEELELGMILVEIHMAKIHALREWQAQAMANSPQPESHVNGAPARQAA